VLAMTIWLPWLDRGKSYRGMVASLKHALPANYNCLAGSNVGSTQRAMLQYFGGIDTRHDASHTCDLLLTQGSGMSGPSENKKEWKKIWEGGRPSDKMERFRLYRKISG
jgi:hypothetical protein